MASRKTQLKELKDKNKSIRTSLDSKTKLQEDLILTMKDDIIDKDWNLCIKTIEEISDNTKHIHQMMNQQMEVTNKTFFIMETVINELDDTKTRLNITETQLNDVKTQLNITETQLNDVKTQLNNTETRVKILGTFRDYITLFIDEEIEKELGNNEWHGVKKSLFKKRVLGAKEDNKIKNLKNILDNKYDITIDEFELLLEMKDISNKTFHKDKQVGIEQAKKILEEQFPDELQKYKKPLSKVLDVLGKN